MCTAVPTTVPLQGKRGGGGEEGWRVCCWCISDEKEGVRGYVSECVDDMLMDVLLICF